MPIYEFECKKCKHVFETIVPSCNSPFPPCEKCGSKRIQKSISLFASSGSGGGGASCGSCSSSSCGSCH